MKELLSVVITCKNAEAHIKRTVESVQQLSSDIVLYDTGSTDATLEIANNLPIQIYQGPWEGFGISRNRTLAKAKHNWVLVIDSDEMADEQLVHEIKALPPTDAKTAYAIRLKNFLGNKELHWGDWGYDCRIRLFNKQVVRWDDSIVHEQLLLQTGMQIKKLKGHLLHTNAANTHDYSKKLRWYAFLTAEKYYGIGRKPTWLRRYFSASFTFIRIYFLRAGFLDGWYGFVIAQLMAYYTFLKYARLHELTKTATPKKA